MTSQVTFVKLSHIHPDHQHLIEPSMVSAKVSCHRCHGRGYIGWTQDTTGKIESYAWCSCLVVDMNKLSDKMATAKAAAHTEETNAQA